MLELSSVSWPDVDAVTSTLPLGRLSTSPSTMLVIELFEYVYVLVALSPFSLNPRTVDPAPEPAPLLNRRNVPSASMWWPWLTDQVPTPLTFLLASFGLVPPSCQMSWPVRDTFTYRFGLRSPSVYVLSDG